MLNLFPQNMLNFAKNACEIFAESTLLSKLSNFREYNILRKINGQNTPKQIIRLKIIEQLQITAKKCLHCAEIDYFFI